ncbi:uncharacterized protein Tco025E_01087 [Trypanosoma conorhini]|uniref:Uncharacterized protein n=1 Tax=Trypanosoma conorhini TaxID=83891 RepID=A0A3R7N7G4_9TRYP|nr:uncharacterized protein Tco025E_01087 [Trypanosoma conorhini]RNF26689.1 hypothetical protein Tco025E_01087 [Trypanosoma conorhini]
MPAKVKDDVIAEVDPATVYFTFSRIRPTFSCGRTIASTLDQFLRHELTPHDLPLLCVLADREGRRYSLNNRRLYLYKELRERGALTTVPVRLRQLPDTRRMREKYTPAKCALRATLKREGAAASAPQQPRSGDGGSDASGAGDGDGAGFVTRAPQRQEDAKGGMKRRGGRATTLEEELLELGV